MLPEGRVGRGGCHIVLEVGAQVTLPVFHGDVGEGVAPVILEGPAGRVLIGGMTVGMGDDAAIGVVLVAHRPAVDVAVVPVAIRRQDGEILAAGECGIGAEIIEVGFDLLADGIQARAQRGTGRVDRRLEQAGVEVLPLGGVEAIVVGRGVFPAGLVDGGEADAVIIAEGAEGKTGARAHGEDAGAVVGKPVGKVLHLLGHRAAPGHGGKGGFRAAAYVPFVHGAIAVLVTDVAGLVLLISRAFVDVKGDGPEGVLSPAAIIPIGRACMLLDQVKAAAPWLKGIVVSRRRIGIRIAGAVMLGPRNVVLLRVVIDDVDRR